MLRSQIQIHQVISYSILQTRQLHFSSPSLDEYGDDDHNDADNDDSDDYDYDGDDDDDEDKDDY